MLETCLQSQYHNGDLSTIFATIGIVSSMSSNSELSQPAPPEAAPLFFVRIPEGQIFGPIRLDQLDRWVVEGRIDNRCQLRHADSKVWEKPENQYPILALPEQLGAGSPFQQASLDHDRVSHLPPNRRSLTLLFAMLGIVGACPVFSVAAWWMSFHDFDQIEQERMRTDGRTMLLWAYYLGMIGTIAYGLLFMVGVMVTLLQILL